MKFSRMFISASNVLCCGCAGPAGRGEYICIYTDFIRISHPIVVLKKSVTSFNFPCLDTTRKQISFHRRHVFVIDRYTYRDVSTALYYETHTCMCRSYEHVVYSFLWILVIAINIKYIEMNETQAYIYVLS